MQTCKCVWAVRGCDAVVIPGIYQSTKCGLWQWSAFSDERSTQSLHKSVMIQKCTRKNVSIFIERLCVCMCLWPSTTAGMYCYTRVKSWADTIRCRLDKSCSVWLLLLRHVVGAWPSFGHVRKQNENLCPNGARIIKVVFEVSVEIISCFII